jgi:hypothetical protein
MPRPAPARPAPPPSRAITAAYGVPAIRVPISWLFARFDRAVATCATALASIARASASFACVYWIEPAVSADCIARLSRIARMPASSAAAATSAACAFCSFAAAASRSLCAFVIVTSAAAFSACAFAISACRSAFHAMADLLTATQVCAK